ncbi:hypothetical protein SKAU_G00259120 [Synaphobranchus kaupii]|uniref:Uncharacterized protein n=1 Tax=Synaphobranchus kaupii TaxID=118154 RepID=A0A9Q1ISP6_SYNKA|nr:hypothetical protein SKAU_G00259120 [Synaphobranchus kaupii]
MTKRAPRCLFILLFVQRNKGIASFARDTFVPELRAPSVAVGYRSPDCNTVETVTTAPLVASQVDMH